MSSDRLHDLFKLGGDEDNAHALRSQVKHDLLNFSLGTDIDTTGRLVQNQQLGVRGQPTANEHLLLVAAGEILDRA